MENFDKHLDPRVQRTRKAFQQALIELIPEKGYGEISVKDITQRAGLNRTTFYLHFHNKEDLLVNGFEEIWDELIAALPLTSLSSATGQSSCLTRSCLLAEVHKLEDYRPIFRAVLSRKGAPLFKQRLQDQVLVCWKKELEPSSFREELAPEAVLIFLASAYLGLLTWWLDGEPGCTPEQLVDLIVELFSLPPCVILGVELPPAGKPEAAKSDLEGERRDGTC